MSRNNPPGNSDPNSSGKRVAPTIWLAFIPLAIFAVLGIYWLAVLKLYLWRVRALREAKNALRNKVHIREGQFKGQFGDIPGEEEDEEKVGLLSNGNGIHSNGNGT